MELSLDYMAGCMDADGHFTWRAGRYQCPDLGVTNTSESLLRAIEETFGGASSVQRGLCPPGCDVIAKGHYHRRSPVLKWHMTGFRAVLLCEALAPRLVIKADKAVEIARKYRDTLVTMERPARRIHHMEKEQRWWDAQPWS